MLKFSILSLNSAKISKFLAPKLCTYVTIFQLENFFISAKIYRKGQLPTNASCHGANATHYTGWCKKSPEHLHALFSRMVEMNQLKIIYVMSKHQRISVKIFA